MQINAATKAFLKVRDPVSNRQRHQLAVISEFATEIAHVPGLENIVEVALTRQFDDEKESAIVHAIAHTFVDVDLSELATEQLSIIEELKNALQLRGVHFSGVDRDVVCDVSLRRPRVLVPAARRHQIIDAVHRLAHPSGKATLRIISRSYVWHGMRQDILRWAGQCEACATSKVSRHTTPPVIPIVVPAERFAHGHRGPILTRRRASIHHDNGGSHDTVARGRTDFGNLSGNDTADVSHELGSSVWHSLYGDFG